MVLATSCGCPPRRCSSDTITDIPTPPPGRRACARLAASHRVRPLQDGQRVGDAADCPSTVDRSARDRSPHHTRRAAASLPPPREHRLAVPRRSQRIESLRHDRHDRLHGIRLLERARARLLVRRPHRNRTRDALLREPAQQTEVRASQRRAACGHGVPMPACTSRSRRCIPRPRRPRRCVR